MKKFCSAILLLVCTKFTVAQNAGIIVPNPGVNLSILKDTRIDAEKANNGTINNSLRFGPGAYQAKVYATNISGSAATFSGKWKLMIMGSY